MPRETTPCRNASCSGGVATEGAHCNGAGTCGAVVQHTCGSYACGFSDCRTSCSSITDCAVSAFCSQGQCQADTQPPTITLSLPPYTNHPIDLSADVADNGKIVKVELWINGALVTPASFDASTGKFTKAQLPLQEGPNAVNVVATDRAGKTGGQQVVVILDTHAPVLHFVTPLPNQAVGSDIVDTTLQVSDATPTVVSLGGQSFFLNASGPVSAAVQVAGDGYQTITVSAQDSAGNVGTATLPVLVDLQAPAVDVDVANGATFGPLPGNVLPVTVHVNDLAATTVEIGSQSYQLARGGGVVQAIVLPSGRDEPVHGPGYQRDGQDRRARRPGLLRHHASRSDPHDSRGPQLHSRDCRAFVGSVRQPLGRCAGTVSGRRRARRASDERSRRALDAGLRHPRAR